MKPKHSDAEVGELSADTAVHRLRRERELNSLYATARTLTALGDVNTVLASIVRHAHELIGTDVTYLSVLDEDQAELTLRASEGSLSEAFRSAQVPANTGVGGRVLQTHAPVWVKNYLTDPTLVHDPEFDRELGHEGIVALLGVPLRDGNRVFGILYAADRIERPFHIDEVALLSAFADHAAVALQNARLYQESREALAELREAYSTIERSAQVHEALTRVVLTGGGAREVADVLVTALGGRVSLYDRDDHVLVIAGDLSGGPDVLGGELRAPLAESRGSGRCITMVDSAGEFHGVVAVLAGDSYLGAVVLSLAQNPTEADRHILERASQIVGLMTLKQNAVVQAEERVRGELLTELITSPRPYGAEIRARAESRRLSVDGFNALLVVQCPTLRAADVVRHLHRISYEQTALAGLHLGAATMLLRTDDMDVAAAELHRRLRAALRAPVLVCTSPILPSHENLQRPFTLASRCARILHHLGVSDRSTSTTQLGVYAMLFDPDRGDDLQFFLSDTLGHLLEYDQRRSSGLVATLAAYFENSGNLTRTSKDLHIHMNTLVKRLDRIALVIGDAWRQPENALPLQLAVRLHTLIHEPPLSAELRL